LGTVSRLGRNDEVGFSREDFVESGVVVEAVIQQKQIPLFKVLDELADEFMLRGADFVEDESEGSTTDQIKEATEFDGNRPQSLLAFVGTETSVKGSGFGQGERSLIGGQQAQPLPTTGAVLAGLLQSCDQRAIHPG